MMRDSSPKLRSQPFGPLARVRTVFRVGCRGTTIAARSALSTSSSTVGEVLDRKGSARLQRIHFQALRMHTRSTPPLVDARLTLAAVQQDFPDLPREALVKEDL